MTHNSHCLDFFFLFNHMLCVCAHVLLRCFPSTAMHKFWDIKKKKKTDSGDLSRQDVLDLFCFTAVKLPRPNHPVPCTGKVIKLVPMRVSSLIMPAPDILLTPLSHYESWKCTTSHLTSPHLADRMTEWRILISLASQPAMHHDDNFMNGWFSSWLFDEEGNYNDNLNRGLYLL